MENTFTLYANMFSTDAKPVKSPWRRWVAEMSKVIETNLPKTRLPCFILGKIPEGERRRNANVLTVEGLALDVERKEQTPEDYSDQVSHALERLEPYEYVAYTTYSHSAEDPRLRIVLPLACPAPPGDYRNLMGFLNSLVGGVADLGAQKLSQPVFAPMCPEGKSDEANAWHNEGEILDPNDHFVKEVIDIRKSLGEGLGRAPHDAHIRQACKCILKSKPYAQPGARDETATRIAWHLAKRHRDATYEAVETVFHGSITAMGSDAPDAENIYNKLTRGAEKRDDEQAIQEQLANRPDGEPLIVQYRTSYYFRLPEGGYTRPIIKDESPYFAAKHLAAHEGTSLTYVSDTGKERNKTLATLVCQYGTIAGEVKMDLARPISTYDQQEDTFYETPVRWPRDLEPLFDPHIDQWIDMLGGQKLKDWLSILADLERLSSALVIMGPRNIGKTLLAMGCAARFGSSSPAKQAALTGYFQEELARCPLIYIDEEVDDNPFHRNFLATVRNELSVRERSVNRKYIAPVQMVGAIRCIISSNHLPFKQKDAQTGQDLEAIAERFYWINADRRAASFLSEQGARMLNYWREEGIPRYIRHLEETRSVPKSTRFGVSGDSEALADLINISVRWNSWVTEWICNGAMDKFSKLNSGTKDIINGAVIHNGDIYVRVKTVVNAWERYLINNRTAPDTRPISEALKGIAVPDVRFRPRDIGINNGNNQQRYYKIRRSPLVAFLEQTGSGTAEELDEALNGNAS